MNKHRAPAYLLFYGIVCIAMSGCFGTRPPARPEVQIRADALIKRAIRSEQKNELQQARENLEEALRLSTSIEDRPTQVQVLVNLARLNRLHGALNLATEQIDHALSLLTPEADGFSEAAHEKALILLAGGGDILMARKWAEKAVDAERSADTGRRINLLGRVLIIMQETHAAEKVLNTALVENRKNGLREEEANSLRMLGIAARLNRNFGEAERLLKEALQIDKQLAASNKIAADLEELAATALVAGRPAQAVNYLERASNVNIAAGRRLKAAANLKEAARDYDILGDAAMAEKSRKRATELSVVPSSQPVDTTNPSSRP